MNLKEFDKLTKRDFENGAVIDEIRQTFKNYEETLRMRHNCLLLNKDLVDSSLIFWTKVGDFLNTKFFEQKILFYFNSIISCQQ